MSAVFTVYQTTCLVNGKTYIGCHKTTDPNDSYLGSGTYFSKAVQKYGKENFKKEVLFIFDNAEEMLAKERELVVVDPDKTYNLDRGGWPGFGSRPQEKVLAATRKRNDAQQERCSSDPEYHARIQQVAKNARKQFLKRLEEPDFASSFKEKMHPIQTMAKEAALSPESKLKRVESFTRIQHQSGETNSQFGTCWVKKDGISLKISLSCLEQYLSEGYLRGRILTSRS